MTDGSGTWLIILSVFVAIQAAYVALRVTIAARNGDARHKRRGVAGAAFTFATGIWGMHFIGLLAIPWAANTDYLVLPTVISLLVCVLVVGGGWLVTLLMPPSSAAFAAPALLMGAGIASMHYIGMLALHASLTMAHDWRFVVASIALAVAASYLSLWLSFGAGRKPPLVISAILLGGAVAIMHYVAMAGMQAAPHAGNHGVGAQFSGTTLALIVAFVAFAISGGLLLTLVPERAGAPGSAGIGASPAPASHAPLNEPIRAHPPQTSREPVQARPASARRSAAISLEARAANKAERPLARHSERIPIERKGIASFIASSAIVAIRAEGHYTYLFDGEVEFFCPVSIGELENRLDPRHFMRVHRRHILCLARVTASGRQGDGGWAELGGRAPLTVPISRACLADFRARLEQPSEALPKGAA